MKRKDFMDGIKLLAFAIILIGLSNNFKSISILGINFGIVFWVSIFCAIAILIFGIFVFLGKGHFLFKEESN